MKDPRCQEQKQDDFRGVIYYILLAFGYSWPIFLIVDAWLVPHYLAQENRAAVLVSLFLGHYLAMVGPALASMILWRKHHKTSYPRWKWSKFKYYIISSSFMTVLWLGPALLGLIIDDSLSIRTPTELYEWVLIGSLFTILWGAGLSEEVGWTAYLLPRLAPHVGKSRALVISGTIRGLWHLPVLLGPVIAEVLTGEQTIGKFLILIVVFSLQLILSNALFGTLFGWVWYKTESLPLLGWLHQWYDLVRDVSTLIIVGYASSIWFSFWAFPFYMIAVTILQKVAREEGANIWTLARPNHL